MADLVVTVSLVKKVAGSTKTDEGVAGTTITAGQSLYEDQSDASKLKLADADALDTSVVKGIALHAALADQPVEYAWGGLLDVGATVAVGMYYVASTNPGGIAPYTDLAAGDFPGGIGFGVTAGRIDVRINNPRVAKA